METVEHARSPDRAPARGPRPSLRGRLHLAGAILLVATSPLLLAPATSPGRRWAAAVFLVSAFVMLGTSAAYHVVNWGPAMVGPMRRADHSAIFVGIAGTYTPFLVVALDGSFRTWMLVGVWVGAAAGIAVNNVFHHAPSWVRTAPYLILGWVSVILVPALWRLSPTVLWLVVAGGLAYTIGAVVYARRRPDPWPATFGYHELFHALTLVAITLHWFGVRIAIAL
ncbi:MAG TPA: hemolysin III family protein [Nitriliruptoraceae bacterium]|nr:hemolysin III family protein [Nitriliruptoraceae bacterium]